MNNRYVYWKDGSCPRFSICMNTFNHGSDGIIVSTVICIPRPRHNRDLGPGDRQTGFVRATNENLDKPAELIVSVPLAKAIPLASVAALIEGAF
jgi:hypothetical protein